MTFARPDFLWLVLLALPVVALHLVRRRRRRTPVPSLLLWDEVLARATRRLGFRRVAAWLSLLLVLLAIGAGAIAAADPRGGHPAPPPRPLLLAIGASARMGGERFDAALAIAREEVAKKAPVDPVTVFLVSAAPRILVRGAADAAAVDAALAAARPSLVLADWAVAAPAMREVLAAGGRAVAIGVRPEAPDGAAVRTVGGPDAGITHFGVRPGEADAEVWLRVAGDLAGREVVATLDGKEVARAAATPEVRLAVPRGAGGLLRVALEPPAGPAFDDAAEAVVAPVVRLRVGVVATGGPDPFLAAALRVLADRLDPEGSGVLPPDRLAEAAESFDVLVLTGEVPDALPPGDYLVLGPPPAALGLEPGPAVEAAPVWERAEDHPVTRGVDAAEVQVLGARPARLPAGATALLAVPDGAVAAAGERDGARWVWIGLGAEDSTLPVTGAFPLLLRNALAWFADLRADPLPPAVRAGEDLEPVVALPPGISAVTVEPPGGASAEVVAVESGRFRAAVPAGSEGEVRVRIGAGVRTTRSNVLLPGETAVAPAAPRGPPAPDRSGLRDTERRRWPWFAAAAAVFLLLEWGVGRLVREE